MATKRKPTSVPVNTGITEDARAAAGAPVPMGGPTTIPGLDPTTTEPNRKVLGQPVSEVGISYVSSSQNYQFFWGGVAVPQQIDDAEVLFGIDLYPKMADEEATLGGAVKTLKTRVMSNGLTILNSHTEPKESASDEEKADFKRSKEIGDYVRAVIERLAVKDRPIEETLRNALDCSYMGHKLAEMTADIIDDGPWKGKMGLCQFGTKPRQNYAFVVNSGTNQFLGVIAKVPGGSIALRTGIVFDPSYIPNMIAPEKLINFTLDDRDGDPRGKSWFRPLYTSWYCKQTTRIQCEKALSAFAGGLVTITIPQTKASELFQNPVTGKWDTLMNCSVAAAAEMGSGRIAVFNDGTDVTVHMPTGELKAFEATFARLDREMVTCFLLSSRSILEAEHGSKADSGASQDLLDELVDYIRLRFCALLTLRMFRWLVRNSFDEETAAKYCPTASMQNTSEPDMAEVATAVAALQTAQWPFTDEQRDFINTEKLGLPAGIEQPAEEPVLTDPAADPTKGGEPGVDPATFRRRQPEEGRGASGAGGGAQAEKESGQGGGGAEGVQKTGGGAGGQGKEGEGGTKPTTGTAKDGKADKGAGFADSGRLRQIDAGRFREASRFKQAA